MNFTALALVGMAVGVAQPPADYYPIKSRSLKLDIDYKPEQRKAIQQVQLCVSRDQGQTWEVADAVLPDRDHFVFTAKDDGLYWLAMLIVFKDGKKDPPDITRVPADRIQKLIVDTTAPVVRITSAKRDGEEVAVEWTVEDKFPNDAATQVQFKPTGPGAVGDWQPVPAGTAGKRSARFKPGTSGPVAVQVVALDFAGNSGSAAQEVPAGTTVGYVAPVGNSGGTPGKPAGPPEHTGEGPLAPPSLSGIGTGPVAPPSIAPAAPSTPSQPVQVAPPPTTPAVAPQETQTHPAPPPAAPNPTPWTPPANPQPPAPLPVADQGPQPIAVGAGFSSPPPAATPAAANVQYINFLRFDLNYQLDTGPSGVSRIDLYVTRDDGRSWTKWSQHDGRESPLKVTLEGRYNTQPEGDYGFRLVPVSGVGLTDGAPAPGSPPEMRVHVDLTPPYIQVWAPKADPNQRNALVLIWKATDRNFGRDPIAIEWSEQPTGPWKPVAGDATVPAVGQPPAASNRIPNTGTYTWQLPATLTTHRVYFKFTAWDAAGNRSEVITPPQLVDLTTPHAKIQGIGGAVPRP